MRKTSMVPAGKKGQELPIKGASTKASGASPLQMQQLENLVQDVNIVRKVLKVPLDPMNPAYSH